MDNNNNNMMELNTEETQKRRERQEKKENFKKKIKDFKEKMKEDKEDRQKAKEEQERVKEQERLAKEAEKAKNTPPPTTPQNNNSSSYSEITVTNETIQQPTNTKTKKVKYQPSASEERRKKAKRKRIIRNIMTIPEIILVILLALFLKNKYIEYSKDVHQILNYSAGDYIYEIHRDNDAMKVVKNHRKECATAPCEVEKITEYDIKFGKKQMMLLRVFMDIELKFKSETKSIVLSDIKTDWGKRCIYSIIHNSNYFVSFKSYKNYSVIEFEQIGDQTKKGFKYDANEKIINIAMGEKSSSGYGLVVTNVFRKDDDIFIYVKEQVPEDGVTNVSVVTHPVLRVKIEDTPKNIYVYDVDTGEEYPNYDAPAVPEARMIQSRKEITSMVEDFIGILQKELEKD